MRAPSNRVLATLAVVLALASVVVGPPARGTSVAFAGWSATWGTAQSTPVSVGSWQDQTLRMVVRTSLGGTQLRIRLSNVFATSTAPFAHVSVGVQQNGGATQAVPVQVTFAGSASVTLAPGASAVSDPVAFPVAANTRLLVSLYIPAGAGIVSAPEHVLPDETEYNVNGSDATAVQAPVWSNTFNFTTYLAGVDVGTATPVSVVAVGDSITDGNGAGTDTDTRWPDYLAARAAPSGYAVVNEGISGDWVTADQPYAPSVSSRWLRDVLSVPGVRTVIDQGGINDMRGGASAGTLESMQTTLIGQAHAAGVRVLLSTVTPCSGASGCGSSFEANRLAYNAWVRGGTTADGFVDFDAAVGNGNALNPAYDSGDHLHPNSAGYAVMANSIQTGGL
jgi:lysophospholipase L1-like esterase